MVSLLKKISRRKTSADVIEFESRLIRVLGLFDLVSLGIGSTLGLGIYVLAGAVAYDVAGPAVTISFLVAGTASGIAALCYAEFAARVPKAGSAYIYSYVTIGEFIAFTIGWCLICEYIISVSGVARGVSGYLDSLVGYRISTLMNNTMHMNNDALGDYPDFLASLFILMLTVLLAFGVKESSVTNIVFTIINLSSISVAIVCAFICANPHNWALADVPEGFGNGGFLPFGISGVFIGAARCFFGFVGFDGIATTGEEAIEPQRNIPLAILISLFIVLLTYLGLSTALTMILPYYELDPNAALVHAFGDIEWFVPMWIVTVGAFFALCTSLIGGMFPLPRILYAMGSDGLIFIIFGNINRYTNTPLLATLISGLITAFMAILFNLRQLIDLMSIGTLLAYTIVAVCVVLLRYEDIDNDMEEVPCTCSNLWIQLLNVHAIKQPTTLSANVARWTTLAFVMTCLLWSGFADLFELTTNERRHLTWKENSILLVFGTLPMLLMIVICRQPKANPQIYFKVPFVPYLPGFSIFINLYLMFQLDWMTWVRLAVWLIIGYAIYFGYGIRNSNLNDEIEDEVNANDRKGG